MNGVKSPLPSGWAMKKLGDTLEYVQYGLSMSSSTEGTYPLFRMNNFAEGKVVASNLAYVELSDSEASKFLLEQDDILFNRTNSPALVGKTGIFQLPGKYVFASYLVRLRVNKLVACPQYINYVLNEPSIKQLLARLATPGVSQSNINPTTLQEKVVFPLPPLSEQKRIADTLDIWDEAISLQTRQLQQLQRRKDKLYTELLSGSSRLPGFTQEWEQSTLGAYFAERVERGNVELPLLSITANQGIIHRDTLEKRDTSNEDKSKYKRIRVGDIGYNTMRMWQGVSSLSTLDGIVSPAYTILRPLTNCDAGFMAHFFKWSPMVHRFWRHSQGLVDDTLLCKYDSFKTVPANVPAVAEQRAIAEILNTAEAEIRLNERKLEALREQKRGLLQQLLTGEILLS